MAACNKCEEGINEDTGLRCEYCNGHGFVPDDDAVDMDSDEYFEPCSKCDLPDACADFGCAIKNGVRKMNGHNFDVDEWNF